MEYKDIYLANTGSTNQVAAEHGAKGAAHGTGVIADTQTAGRGRLDRIWFSPAGKNLYCSYIIRSSVAPQDYPKLTLVAGVSACECLNSFSAVGVGLKWPNDLYIGKRKCGGILCESYLSERDTHKHYAVVGIGINLNMSEDEFPDELRATATSLVAEGAEPVDPGVVFQVLRGLLLERVLEFETEGFGSIRKRWERYDLFRGQWMTWVTPQGKAVRGKNLGPDETGTLKVEDEKGKIHVVVSGDVSLAE